jgi:hypothetical protein
MIRHNVVSGDTLSHIASYYYGNSALYPLLARANDIQNPDLICVGDTLNIPNRLYEKGKSNGSNSILVLRFHPCVIQEPTCSLQLDKSELSFCQTAANETIQATGSPFGGAYSWEIADPSVASVADNGDTAIIAPLKVGKTDVTVTYKRGDLSAIKKAVVMVCTCTPGRKYAYAKKEMTGLIGVKAKIKTRRGKVAGEAMKCSKAEAYYVAYANISGTLNGQLAWAQTGFGRERNAGSSDIKTYRYAEMNGNVYKVKYDNANAPLDRSELVYECVLDKNNGTWTFYQQGVKWQVFADAGWKNLTGDSVQWTGEIYNKEDDMAGTAAEKCTFSECQIKLAGKEYASPNLTDGDVSSDDAAEWGAERNSGNAISIWDVNPLW